MASAGREPAMSGFMVKEIDSMHAVNGGTTRLAGAELGVESFGLQVFDFPPHYADYPEHDHSHDGQEEVYVVLRGSAEFEVGGERVAVQPGRMLRVEPDTMRKLVPGSDGVRILVIGSPPGGAYERPEGLRLSSHP